MNCEKHGRAAAMNHAADSPSDQDADKAITSILRNPQLLQVLTMRSNGFGESKLPETLKKVSYGREIATSFGFDKTVTAAIQTIHDLAAPNFGPVGDEFLHEIDPQYTRGLYGRRLGEKLLHGIGHEKVKMICDGVERVFRDVHATPEEMIVCMMESCFEFTRSLASRSMEFLFASQYRYHVIDKSAEAGRLIQCPIPPNNLERRDPVTYSDEEKVQMKRVLYDRYEHVLAHPDEMEESFKEGWHDISEQILASYYAVGFNYADPGM